jgi:hypothetical protein
MAPQPPSKLKKHQSLVNPFRTQNLVKPQVGFLNKPDNTAVTPWKPILTSKPHATIPLAQSLGTFTDELQHLQYDYTVFLLLLLYDPACRNPEGLSKQQRRSMAHKTRRFSPLGSSSITDGHLDTSIRTRPKFWSCSIQTPCTTKPTRSPLKTSNSPKPPSLIPSKAF